MDLSGKVAVVTGGAAGIGKGIALRMADAGADIVVADVDTATAEKTAQTIEAQGRRALALHTDVSRKATIEEMVAHTQDALGRIDILVNNAGVERITPLFDVTEEEWDFILRVNLKGAFLCAQVIGQAMAADGDGGKIVNVGSIAGFVPPRGEPHYSASKAGVHALTKQLARELAPHRINVNAIAPGVIRNGLSTRQSLADAERARQLEASIPWGRVGSPRDIGNAVCFLASHDADYITGVVLTVDGGYLLVSA